MALNTLAHRWRPYARPEKTFGNTSCRDIQHDLAMQSAQAAVLSNLHTLIAAPNGPFCPDITIVDADKKEWKAHLIVLAASSPFFQRQALLLDERPTTTLTSITLSLRTASFQAALTYIYSGLYHFDPQTPDRGISTHIAAFRAAELLDVPALAHLVEAHVREYLRPGYDHAQAGHLARTLAEEGIMEGNLRGVWRELQCRARRYLEEEEKWKWRREWAVKAGKAALPVVP
ncbi:MAG: hypothetical protein M1828_000040 [Chrysothrix sp. TS-e1954]|nr:MAG: hypothetical protein M1828_000040 [Chrysothrix sp. TS-e1954]